MRAYQAPYEQKIYGGMNDALDPTLVNEYEGVLVQNGVIREAGSFTGRAGATLYGSDTGSQKILGWGVKRNATRFITRIVNGSSTATVQGISGSTWSDIASATVKKDTDVITAECSNGAVYYFNGDATSAPGKYDGSSWSTVSGMPDGSGGAEWKNFLFVWGVAAYPKRLYISNIGAPETFTATDYIDFPEEIVGAKPYFNRLVVGMKRSIAYIVGSGTTDFVVSGATVYVPTAFGFGVSSYESMQLVDNELWCQDEEGNIRKVFRSDNDEVFGGVVSDKIQGIIDGLNKNALNKTTAAYVNGYYIFYSPNGAATENNVGAMYDTQAILPDGISRWSKLTGWTPSHFTIYEASQTPELYWGENTADSKTYKWSGVSDNGTAIEMIWRSKKNEVKYPNRLKLFKWGRQEYKAIGSYSGYIKADIDDAGMNTIKTVSFLGNTHTLGVDWTLGVDELGAKSRLDTDFYFKDGGSDIAGKHCQVELNASYSVAIPTWYKQTYLFKVLNMR